MQPLHHDPPTSLMRGIADALYCAPPPSRWSPGGVFLGDLSDRYVALAARLRRQGEPDAMSAERHADWFAMLACDPLPVDSVCRIFADLQLWEDDPEGFDTVFRDVLRARVRLATVSFVESVGRNR